MAPLLPKQEVTDLLHMALKFQNYPPAGMSYCRQAIECIVHHKYFLESGKIPTSDDEGRFPSLLSITKKVGDCLGRQTREVIGSINAQSRGSLHWDFHSRGMGAEKHHVQAVVNQVAIVFKDIFDVEIQLDLLQSVMWEDKL